MLNRSIYNGFCILDISEVLMYELHYLRRKDPGEKSKLLHKDTDSLTYVIKTVGLTRVLYNDKHCFGFSGYDRDRVHITILKIKRSPEK